MVVVVPQNFASIQKPEEELVRKEYQIRIGAILRVHNPSKLGNLPKLLDKYKGKEHSLYQKVCQKYKEPTMEEYDAPARESSTNPDLTNAGHKACGTEGTSKTPVVVDQGSQNSGRGMGETNGGAHIPIVMEVALTPDHPPCEILAPSPGSETPLNDVIEELKQALGEAKSNIDALRQLKEIHLLEIESLRSEQDKNLSEIQSLLKEKSTWLWEFERLQMEQSKLTLQLGKVQEEKDKAILRVNNLQIENGVYVQKLKEAKEEIAEMQQVNKHMCESNLELSDKMTKMGAKLENISSSFQLPLALTTPFLNRFSPKELQEQDEQLCALTLEIARVRGKIQDAQESAKTCGICFDHKKDCILNPCGHGYCFQCASQITRCAFCKQHKTSVIKVFW